MSENVSRLDRLRNVREWLVWQLRRTDDTIAELERQEIAAGRAAATLPPSHTWVEARDAANGRQANP